MLTRGAVLLKGFLRALFPKPTSLWPSSPISPARAIILQQTLWPAKMASDSKEYAERQRKRADFVHGLMYQIRTVKYHSLLPANVFKEQSKYLSNCPWAAHRPCQPGAQER